jgi:uncharacterized membrane protein
MVDRIKSTVEIHAPAKKCYDRWLEFENFPRFMSHVDRVSWLEDKNVWHWIIATPVGRSVEWDIVVDTDERNRRLSWHTVQSDEEVSKVQVQGTVRFDQVAPNRTQVTCAIQFEMPGRPVSEALAELFIHPQTMLDEEMQHFKYRVEGTYKPAEKAVHGKTLTSGTQQLSPEHQYMGPFDLEEVLADEGVEMEDIEDPAIREMIHEENPYLGVEGAWEDEDSWPEPVETKPFEFDVFEESLDIAEEDDLENFTQDMDDNVDTSFFTGQSMEEYEMLREAEQSPAPSRASQRVQSEL